MNETAIIAHSIVISIEFIGVKSRLVWNVKSTNPNVIVAVMTPACSTIKPSIIEIAEATAIDSATVYTAHQSYNMCISFQDNTPIRLPFQQKI